MLKVFFVPVLFATGAFGQNCMTYGTPSTLAGTLFLNDEAGYNQFTALRLTRPICTAPDPRDVADPGLQYERAHSGVRVVQAGVYGSDAASQTLRDRLDRLVGHRVMIKGVLFQAHTGYHRTDVQLSVEAVDAVDAAGRQALRVAKPEFKAKDVAAYDVTINAGPRLLIEAHEIESAMPLLPSDQYISHTMTGGGVLYIDCRDGYDRKLISSTETDGVGCFDGDLCGLSAFPTKPVIFRFRCTRKP
jgi:Domain of unknown function (DUF4431)